MTRLIVAALLVFAASCAKPQLDPAFNESAPKHMRVLWNERVDAYTAVSKTDVDGSCYLLFIRGSSTAAVAVSCLDSGSKR